MASGHWYLPFDTHDASRRLLPHRCIVRPVTQALESTRKVAMKDGITVLDETPLEISRWKNAGFETPQALLQTFLWAVREGDWKVIASCSDSPAAIKPSEADLERLKGTAEAAKGYLALAIRAIVQDVVELKFQVTGWSYPFDEARLPDPLRIVF